LLHIRLFTLLNPLYPQFTFFFPTPRSLQSYILWGYRTHLCHKSANATVE